jgi:hypothetical protein
MQDFVGPMLTIWIQMVATIIPMVMAPPITTLAVAQPILLLMVTSTRSEGLSPFGLRDLLSWHGNGKWLWTRMILAMPFGLFGPLRRGLGNR